MPAGQAPAYGTADAAALPAGPALITWQDGQPFSPLYGDRYHTLSGARAQAEHVFLGGCGLPRAWLSSGRWTILETGFGLGLNFLSTWASWLANRPDPAPASADDDARTARHLRFVSTEAHPVGAAIWPMPGKRNTARGRRPPMTPSCNRWPHNWPSAGPRSPFRPQSCTSASRGPQRYRTAPSN